MKLGCTISLKAAVLPGHQLTGPSEEEEEEETVIAPHNTFLLFDSYKGVIFHPAPHLHAIRFKTKRPLLDNVNILSFYRP
jgi:hypothetical protein